jgi:hypothetical protein
MGHGFTTIPYLTVSSMNLKRDSKLEGFYNEQDQWLISQNEVNDAQK